MRLWSIVASTAALSMVVVAPGAAATGPVEPGAAPVTVTLVTGDKVILRGDRVAPEVQVAKGRERISHAIQRFAGHTYVIPSDAAAAINTGRVDRRLFDVSTLAEFGYDDTKRDSLPLMVSGGFAAAGVQTTASLGSVGLAAATVDKQSAAQAWTALLAGGGKVWLDGKRKATLDRSAAQIGAPEAWKTGLTGEGVKVAVLDTGVDQTHPDLKTQEVGERNFTTSPDAVDRVGHGTHVASTIAGAGAKYKGVAHGARVLDGKVLDDYGFGQDSWIIAGMQWAVDEGAAVVNLSLGGTDAPGIDPVEEAVNTLSAQHGTLFVIASGNSGPSAETVGSPGSADAALTVGAVDRADSMADFSSRGPRAGDGGVKPDITAPGVGIAAAKAAEGVIGKPVEPGYVALDGTSMATPHVAGAAALLKQQHPDWTGQRVKEQLTASAKPTGSAGVFDQGAGRVDVAKALTQTLTSSPTSLNLGLQQWPHDDDKPITTTYDYRNSGKENVTVDLAVETTGPDGKPAPEGMFTVSPTKLTVPAGGTAKVTLTADTRKGSADGTFSGTVVAGGVRTPFAVAREVESYDATVTVLGPDGKPRADYGVLMAGVNGWRMGTDPSGVNVLRAPRGDYMIDTYVVDGERAYSLFHGKLDLVANRSVTLDAREAKPIDQRPEDPTATFRSEQGGFTFTFGNVLYLGGVTSNVADGAFTKFYGPDLPAEAMNGFAATTMTSERGDYHLLKFLQGKGFTGYDRVYRATELGTAKVTVEADGGRGSIGLTGISPDGTIGIGYMDRGAPLPQTKTFLAASDVRDWSSELLFRDDTEDLLGGLESPKITLPANKTTEHRFNRPIIGPSGEYAPLARFTNDKLAYGPALFSDALGNRGWSTGTGKVELFRDGTLIGQSDRGDGGSFPVPADKAHYRVAGTMTRTPQFPNSTRVDTAWTFESGHADHLVELALPVIRFGAHIAEDGTAPAGKPFTIPVTLETLGKRTDPHHLTAEVSYDDGKTWTKAPIAGNRIILSHPATGTVSLRAKAADRHGQENEVTIIKAYKLR